LYYNTGMELGGKKRAGAGVSKGRSKPWGKRTGGKTFSAQKLKRTFCFICQGDVGGGEKKLIRTVGKFLPEGAGGKKARRWPEKLGVRHRRPKKSQPPPQETIISLLPSD